MRPGRASAGEVAHSLVAGTLLHGGYLGGCVVGDLLAGLPAGIAGLFNGWTAAADRASCHAIARRTRRAPGSGSGSARGFVGIVLVLAPRLAGIAPDALGSVLVPIAVNLAGVVSVTLGTFYQKRFVPTGATCVPAPACNLSAHLAVVAPLALMTESLRFDPTARLLAALAISVLVLSIAAIALLLLMIRHGEVSRVAALIYLVPPLTALEAFVLFGESLSTVQIVGMAVTAAGVWLATRRT